MTQLQAIRWFMKNVLCEPVTIAKDRMPVFNFGMDIMNPTPRLILPYNLNCKSDEVDKLFRKNFISRCPLAQGFSNITITLLHECGHWATRSIMDVVTYDKMKDKVNGMKEYMEIPWEHLATEWAICWLSSPINRKCAKEFERRYFGYGNDKKSIWD